MMDRLIKSPIEKFPIFFSFGYDMASAETISLKAVTCNNSADGSDSSGTIVSSSAVSGKNVVVVIQAGVEDEEHHIQCLIVTSEGNHLQRDLLLSVQSVVQDDFNKQPDDAFMVQVEFKRRIVSGDSVDLGAVVATGETDGSDQAGTITGVVQVVDTAVGVPVLAGTDGLTYLLGVRAVTAAGYTYEKILRMNVREI